MLCKVETKLIICYIMQSTAMAILYKCQDVPDQVTAAFGMDGDLFLLGN